MRVASNKDKNQEGNNTHKVDKISKNLH